MKLSEYNHHEIISFKYDFLFELFGSVFPENFQGLGFSPSQNKNYRDIIT